MVEENDLLKKLWKKGADFLGSEYAIMGGAMSWISERHLVAAISNAGGFGVIASGAMPLDLLEQEIDGTRELTDKNFGVNVITLRENAEEVLELCKRKNITHIVLAGGMPSASLIKKAKETGAKVICFAPALSLAKRMVRSGADALVIEGSEAGGHIGPVATTILAQEIVPQIGDIPVFVAGGIGCGSAIAASLEMGAAGCQIGTMFVCAKECVAHEKFKKAFIRAKAKDAMPTVQIDPNFPVIPVRAIANKGTQEFMKLQRDLIEQVETGKLEKGKAQMEIEHYWAGALRKAVIEGDVEHGSLMAGQSVGMVKEELPVKDIMEKLVKGAQESLLKRKGLLSA
jgi:enoyl-[acyl-carrier protein] reductase II